MYYTTESLIIALQHTGISEEQAAVLSTLPSPFCVCKQCYDRCEQFSPDKRFCPPLYDQAYVAERIIGFMQFKQMRRQLLTAFGVNEKKAIIFSLAFSELCEELLTTILLMKFPLLATDPNKDDKFRYRTVEEAEKIVVEHWINKVQAEKNAAKRAAKTKERKLQCKLDKTKATARRTR